MVVRPTCNGNTSKRTGDKPTAAAAPSYFMVGLGLVFRYICSVSRLLPVLLMGVCNMARSIHAVPSTHPTSNQPPPPQPTSFDFNVRNSDGRIIHREFLKNTHIDLMVVNFPTGQPSRLPSSQPSRQPSRIPSSQPTRQPSRQPSAQVLPADMIPPLLSLQCYYFYYYYCNYYYYYYYYYYCYYYFYYYYYSHTAAITATTISINTASLHPLPPPSRSLRDNHRCNHHGNLRDNHRISQPDSLPDIPAGSLLPNLQGNLLVILPRNHHVNPSTIQLVNLHDRYFSLLHPFSRASIRIEPLKPPPPQKKKKKNTPPTPSHSLWIRMVNLIH